MSEKKCSEEWARSMHKKPCHLGLVVKFPRETQHTIQWKKRMSRE